MFIRQLPKDTSLAGKDYWVAAEIGDPQNDTERNTKRLSISAIKDFCIAETNAKVETLKVQHSNDVETLKTQHSNDVATLEEQIANAQGAADAAYGYVETLLFGSALFNSVLVKIQDSDGAVRLTFRKDENGVYPFYEEV